MGIETVIKDVVHVVELPFTNAAKIAEILDTALTDEPKLKAAIIEVVNLGECVIADGAVDLASKGLNIPSDLETFKDIQVFFGYLKDTFFPLVSTIYAEVKTEIAPAETVPAETAATIAAPDATPVAAVVVPVAAATVQPGPGLHEVTPA